ncbi:MAG: hypothetical protein OEX22_00875 [Cyclobacteriaceae bacterium]|nr:hypothetical protein [Cyclobacteriaceae bacterium]
MNNPPDDISQVSSLIKKDFGLDHSELTNLTILDELKQQLTQIVTYLLDKDFQRLLSAMYRIDISERKFKEVLSKDPPSEIAANIAQLIIDRELQKVITRRKYSE